MQRHRPSKRVLSDDDSETSRPISKQKSRKKEKARELAREGAVAPAAEQQWSFVTTRTNTSLYVLGEERFTMYEVYMSVDDANRRIQALADVDHGRTGEWDEKFGAYGELTLDSEGKT